MENTEKLSDALDQEPALDPEKESGAERNRDLKKKAAATAVALVTSASLVVGGIFNSPAALLNDDQTLPQVVYDQNDDLDGNGDGGDGDEDSDEEGGGEEGQLQEEKEAAYREPEQIGLRERIQRLPYTVRLLVILPLWAIGWSLLTIASSLWAAVLSPVLGKALAWLLLLGALVGAFVLAGKTLFPDLPIKKILNKRSLLGLVIGSVTLGLADIIVPLFWDGYTRVENLVRAVGVLLVFGTVTLVFARRELRRRRKLAEEVAAAQKPDEEEAEEPAPALTREDILAMADSVSRPRRSPTE